MDRGPWTGVVSDISLTRHLQGLLAQRFSRASKGKRNP
ncbi:hypothetical protein ANO14919_067940 [Xylariales sp. No.14919]|nr:hypothetical protein ANO14919_067940 [Xylariales sp. No.14919]